MCNRSLGCLIWLNYEVVGLQTWSGITKALESVDFWCLSIPRLLYYSSYWLSHRTGSSDHLSVTCLCTRISSRCTGSSTHLGITCLHPSISAPPLVFPCYYLWTILPVTLSPLPTYSFPQYSIQGCPKMCLYRLLVQPFVSTASYPLTALLPCAHLKNRHQNHPLCHLPLSSSDVGHLRPDSCHFTNYFRPGSHLRPVWLPPRPLPCNIPQKPRVCPLNRPLHHCRKYPSLWSKEEYRLCHRPVEHFCQSRVHLFHDWQLPQPTPDLLCSLDVPSYRQPVVVCLVQDPPQILKGCHPLHQRAPLSPV